MVTYIINDKATYKSSIYGDPNKYRAGIAYIGYGNMKFGRNSEKIRHIVQNRIAHDYLIKWATGTKSPHFKVLNIERSNYFSIGTSNVHTLW